MIVYLNGNFLPKSEAHISVDDRGFLFADGLYEVMRSYGGRFFRLRGHLERLQHGCRTLRINCPGIESLEHICVKLISENNLGHEQAIAYIQITRGVAPRAHRFPSPEVPPTIYMATTHFIPHADQLENGIHAITVPDNRWGRCDLKTIALLPNLLAHQQAIEANASEAIFVRDGLLLEGTHSNIFAIIKGEIRTHPRSNHMLPGINRQATLELCQKLKLPYSEAAISVSQLSDASELFATSTTLEITPIVEINGQVIANGCPGEITRLLQIEFRKLL